MIRSLGTLGKSRPTTPPVTSSDDMGVTTTVPTEVFRKETNSGPRSVVTDPYDVWPVRPEKPKRRNFSD
ncbi:MAG: hypothetical protein HZC01_04080 [Candidatus Kerfeldbacteria bacterium]|nr:hypothetical protein [Candidatus Kerfeldbacteria bacterium]